MKIRKLINEIIEKLLEETDVLNGALNNIGTQLDSDLQYVDDIVKTQQIDISDTDNRLKAKLQLKSKLNPSSAERKGLEREIPEAQKDYEKRKIQLKNLEATKQGMMNAQAELEKQRERIKKQNSINSKITNKQQNQSTGSVLPSLKSPI